MTVNVHLHVMAPENISVLRDPVPGQRPYITLRIGEASIFLSPENERCLIAALTAHQSTENNPQQQTGGGSSPIKVATELGSGETDARQGAGTTREIPPASAHGTMVNNHV